MDTTKFNKTPNIIDNNTIGMPHQIDDIVGSINANKSFKDFFFEDRNFNDAEM